MAERMLKLDMDVTLHRAAQRRRWLLQRTRSGWAFCRVINDHEERGDLTDYAAAKDKRFEWEAGIKASREEGFH